MIITFGDLTMTGFKQLVNLVKRFTSSPSSPYTPQDIAITFGEARISYNTQPSDMTRTGHIDRSIYAKLMLDAATLAASSLVEDKDVTNDSFSMYGPIDVHSTRLTAVARLTHSNQDKYTVETRLLDENRNPVGSGHGIFSIRQTSSDEVPQEETAQGSVQEREDRSSRPLRVAYGAMWKSPVGLLHLN